MIHTIQHGTQAHMLVHVEVISMYVISSVNYIRYYAFARPLDIREH